MRRFMDVLTAVTFLIVCAFGIKTLQSPDVARAQAVSQYKVFQVPAQTNKQAVENVMNQGLMQGYHLVAVPNSYFNYMVFEKD